MIRHVDIQDSDLRSKIRRRELIFAGNSKLKIYGLLSCASGRKMKKSNRVFFVSEPEAIQNGYRPCGHCLRRTYKKWKDGFI